MRHGCIVQWEAQVNRKDVELLALCLRSTRPVDLYANHVARLQWYADVSAVAELIKRDGVRFDPSKFFDDCGVPS